MNSTQRGLLAGWLVIWISQLVHFIDIHIRYASAGVHVTHPILYVAVETWMYLSFVACTIIAHRLAS